MSEGYRRLQQDQNSSVATELRKSLLENYDKMSFPFQSLWQETGERKGVPLEVGLNFHRVFKVDVSRSVADLIVWVRQSWRDPRLSWDPSIYNGTMHFWIGDGQGGGETSEIWTPDVHLWNAEEALDESLADAHAIVSSDGTVFWSRPGHVQAVCKFRGLNDFPFDSLSCAMEIGTWSYSGLYVRPIKMGEGFSIGGSETAGESFSEYSIESVTCDEFIYPPFPGAPDEDWPVLMYNITFKRSWQPYARGFLVLQIILNFAAFCCFWMPPQVGERMSLAITSLLAAVASELVVSSSLPTASEITWFAKFSIASLLYSAVAVFESAAVVYFYYHTGDDLVPRWCRMLEKTLKERSKPGSSEKPDERNSTGSSESREEDSFGAKRVGIDEEEVKPERRCSEIDRIGVADGSKEPQATTETESSSAFERRRSSKASTITFRDRREVKTILGRDADDFKNDAEMDNNIRWQKVARAIDDFSRVVFPASYALYLAISFGGVDMSS